MTRRDEVLTRIKRSKARPSLSRSLTIRLPNELYDRLEAYAGTLAAELPGVDLTVSDVVRNLLEQSLVERARTAKDKQRHEAAVDALMNRNPFES